MDKDFLHARVQDFLHTREQSKYLYNTHWTTIYQIYMICVEGVCLSNENVSRRRRRSTTANELSKTHCFLVIILHCFLDTKNKTRLQVTSFKF